MRDFESAFDEFITLKKIKIVENALFAIVRISFLAGWLAAGGNKPKTQSYQTISTDNLINVNKTDL
jgi:hypothetical protein